MLTCAELRLRLTQAQNAIVALESEKELYRSRWLSCVSQEEADRLTAEIARLRTQCVGLAQSAVNNGEGLLKFEMALRKIAELRYSEEGEPFDDALNIADTALA